MQPMIHFFYLMLALACHAHDGHSEHGQIHNGELLGHDGTRYLDAGASVVWANQKLLRKISNNNQIFYQYQGSIADYNAGTQTSELSVKAPGGEKLKGFSFNHAGEKPSQIRVISPSMGTVTEISKSSNFGVMWEGAQSSMIIRIILEVYSSTGQLVGRLTVSTNDDGEFILSPSLLRQLPLGKAQLAVKRISTGGFYLDKERTELVGVRMASSVIGSVRVVP